MGLKEETTRLERQFGVGTIIRLGDASLAGVSSISTGSLNLDRALGVGGLPRGRITEIYGPPGGGKTTIAQQVAASAQKAGGMAAFIDAEHSLDPKYAAALGVNVDDLLVSQPDYGEQGLEIAEGLIKSGEIDVIVVDSVAALVPKAEVEGDMGDNHPGLQARMMSQAMRKLTPVVHKSNAVVIFINQCRFKIGVMYGNPETTAGGEALKFYSGVRIDVRRIAALKKGDDVIGARTRAKIVKNKVAPPFKEAEFDIIYGQGVSKFGEMVDFGTENGLIEKSGSWLTVLGERFQGREKAVAALAESPELAGKLEAAVREKLSA